MNKLARIAFAMMKTGESFRTGTFARARDEPLARLTALGRSRLAPGLFPPCCATLRGTILRGIRQRFCRFEIGKCKNT